jgi:hypothetical protein
MSLIEFKCTRKYNRYQPSENIDIYISVIYSGKLTNKVKAKLRDISESGIGVFSTIALDNDSKVMIDFLFGNTRITTSAQIIYSKEISLGHATGISVGESAKPIMEFIKAMGIELNKV